ncbi:phage capsid protein [Agrobacterium vitis]|uniref:phage capsid protein n=1 Tax=Agrobacterium vitis TaxID=373 RepID=UPI00403E4921
MSSAPNWFVEKIRDMVRVRYMALGGYLDDTMIRGDGGAGVVKFPVLGGRIPMYLISRALQDIDPSEVNMDTITLSLSDYEAAATWFQQDLRKMGPSQQDGISKLLTQAVRMKRDTIKLTALNTFANATSTLTDTPSTVETIGDGTAKIDVEFAAYIGDSIAGTGSDEEAFCAIPQVWMTQLCFNKHFSNADYTGPADLPFAKASKMKKKTFQGTHFVTLPNEYFSFGTGAFGTGSNGLPFNGTGYLDAFAWTKDSMGCEVEWDQENMTIDQVPTLKGSPWLGKVQLSAAAVGILPEGVKRIRMLAINKAVKINE